MKLSQGRLIGLAIVAIALACPAAAQAQQTMDYTVTVTGHARAVKGSAADNFMSFSAPVQIPGVSLAPGTYVFTILPESSVVRVSSEDRRTVYATFFTVPVRRASATDDAQMTFARQGTGAPPRIAAWYLRSQVDGIAPIYPASGAGSYEIITDENATN
jgi:hypothetical protein